MLKHKNVRIFPTICATLTITNVLDVNTKRRLRGSARQARPQLAQARTGSGTVKHVNKLLQSVGQLPAYLHITTWAVPAYTVSRVKRHPIVTIIS